MGTDQSAGKVRATPSRDGQARVHVFCSLTRDPRAVTSRQLGTISRGQRLEERSQLSQPVPVAHSLAQRLVIRLLQAIQRYLSEQGGSSLHVLKIPILFCELSVQSLCPPSFESLIFLHFHLQRISYLS